MKNHQLRFRERRCVAGQVGVCEAAGSRAVSLGTKEILDSSNWKYTSLSASSARHSPSGLKWKRSPQAKVWTVVVRAEDVGPIRAQ